MCNVRCSLQCPRAWPIQQQTEGWTLSFEGPAFLSPDSIRVDTPNDAIPDINEPNQSSRSITYGSEERMGHGPRILTRAPQLASLYAFMLRVFKFKSHAVYTNFIAACRKEFLPRCAVCNSICGRKAVRPSVCSLSFLKGVGHFGPRFQVKGDVPHQPFVHG